MTSGDASVLLRIVPPEFRGPNFAISRNNIYEWVTGNDGRPVRRLVSQLAEGQEVRLPVEQAARLFGGGGQIALNALSAIGSVSSIVNLGVSVLGFIYVSRALKRVEARIERIERKLDALAELAGVIDQKVDQLLSLGEAQMAALSEVRSLMLSFQTAGVHRALETLELRSRDRSPHRDAELMHAARTLHDYRVWLAQLREGSPSRPAPVRAELLRAEVIVSLAEARARCLADDARFASLALERVLEGVRAEAMRMRSEIVASAAVPALLSSMVPGVDDMHAECVSAWSWLDRRSSGHATRELLRNTTRGYNDLAQRVANVAHAFENGTGIFGVRQWHEQGLFCVPALSDADAASFFLTCRLGRGLEPALAMCTAMDVFGESVRKLMNGELLPNSPAFVVELERSDHIASVSGR